MGDNSHGNKIFLLGVLLDPKQHETVSRADHWQGGPAGVQDRKAGLVLPVPHTGTQASEGAVAVGKQNSWFQGGQFPMILEGALELFCGLQGTMEIMESRGCIGSKQR